MYGESDQANDSRAFRFAEKEMKEEDREHDKPPEDLMAVMQGKNAERFKLSDAKLKGYN